MKILLIVVGKTDQQWLTEGISQYIDRLSHYSQFEMQVIPDIRNTRSMEAQVQKVREGEQILKLLQPSDDVWLLDDKGREMTSPEMARWLEKRMAQSTKRLVCALYSWSSSTVLSASSTTSPITMSNSAAALLHLRIEN